MSVNRLQFAGQENTKGALACCRTKIAATSEEEDNNPYILTDDWPIGGKKRQPSERSSSDEGSESDTLSIAAGSFRLFNAVHKFTTAPFGCRKWLGDNLISVRKPLRRARHG